MNLYPFSKTPSKREVMIHQYPLPTSYYPQDAANVPPSPTEIINLPPPTTPIQCSVLKQENHSNSVNSTTDLMVPDGKKPTVESWGASSMIEQKNTDAKGTNTVTFIHPISLPPGKKAAYLHVCGNYCPQKADPFRIRWTVGRNLIEYEGETYTQNADITTAKLLFNSILSTTNAKFLGIDLKDFYLGTTMQRPEYMLVQSRMILDEIIQEYNVKKNGSQRYNSFSNK